LPHPRAAAPLITVKTQEDITMLDRIKLSLNREDAHLLIAALDLAQAHDPNQQIEDEYEAERVDHARNTIMLYPRSIGTHDEIEGRLAEAFAASQDAPIIGLHQIGRWADELADFLNQKED
jgi:hypothetical protein